MTILDLDLFFDDGERKGPPSVKVYEAKASTALSKSSLPGLDFCLNPYIGCEHGCIYCFAPDVVRRQRETWSSEVGYRSNIPVLLNRELRTKRGTIGIGTVTDPYQPLERLLLLTRKCLLEIARHDNPISILTKSDLVLRDIELIRSTARPEVGVTITTMDADLASRIEPKASPPVARVETLRRLADSGIECYAMVGPVLPFLEQQEIRELLGAIAATGCKRVMADRLRMRPGLEMAFLTANIVRSKGVLSDPYRAEMSVRLVRDECTRMGMRFETAF
ncbi:MAG: radical SAM protein [Methanomassiliicoccales archaeon]|nr:MAG: radical SAM protein [Methanomassiliicoccales archaeon]